MNYPKTLVLLSLFRFSLVPLTAGELPVFEAAVVDAKVAIGYGTALEDVDGDGKTDILLADQHQFVWYRNPDWERFVIAENLTEQDNVCIAARDLDGDGRVEIAVGAQWNPADTLNSGAVFYLQAPADRRQPWKPIPLHHEPVVHRMRWVRSAPDEFVLVVAPLHGRGNQGGNGAGVRLLAYKMPSNPGDDWTTELLDDTMHVTHNFDRCQWIGGSESAEEIAYLGREGLIMLSRTDGKWQKSRLDAVGGGGEIRLGRSGNGNKFLATIEPFHGDKLVAYDFATDGSVSKSILDDQLNQGHAVATADLNGNGGDEIVYGWRNANDDGQIGVKMQYRNGDQWQSAWIDENGMACEDLRVADLDTDGRLDIVAAGRSTHNLKIYWNRTQQ